jgi:hypothetical protein
MRLRVGAGIGRLGWGCWLGLPSGEEGVICFTPASQESCFIGLPAGVAEMHKSILLYGLAAALIVAAALWLAFG